MRDLELKARDRRQRRDQDNREGEMIMLGIVIEGNPVNLAYANDGTIPKNHTDAGTVLVLENHIDEVTFIPKNHVDKEIVHICMGMLTEVRTLPRIKGLTMLLWMP